jgi:CCR4-NOT transcription complex subunit 1
MDDLLLNDHPVAHRADFAISLDALTNWLAEDPDLEAGKELMAKLQVSPTDQVLTPPPTGKDQREYVFDEWVRLQLPDVPKKSTAAFIYQLHQNKVLETRESSVQFIRTCLEASVAAHNFEMSQFGTLNPDKATIKIDALAKLIVALVVYHGEQDDAVKLSKADYLDSVLVVVIFVLNHHVQHLGEQGFNPKVFFRLFSTILCELNEAAKNSSFAAFKTELFMVMAKAFLCLQPQTFPLFAFQWLTLMSHRIFIPVMLDDAPQERDTKAERWDMYAQLMEVVLSYTGQLLRPTEESLIVQNFYRGVLRVLLVLHHDYPEFLAENHFRFCNNIPMHCTQLRNLIVSAYPVAVMDMPDPFTVGLQVDLNDDIRQAPVIHEDMDAILSTAGIKNVVDTLLKTSEIKLELVQKICEATYYKEPKPAGFEAETTTADPALIHALVLYIGIKDLASQGSKGPNFSSTSPAGKLIESLAREFRPEAKFHFISAIANQLRWPSAHTYYFCHALLSLYGTPNDDAQAQDIAQVITRILLERLLVHRPHPWGLIVTLLELLKGRDYGFWHRSFTKAAPEVQRLIDALFTHAQQSPRG